MNAKAPSRPAASPPTSASPAAPRRSGLLQPGGALHPGVSWARFAVAGVVGFVFLAAVFALALLVPGSTPWLCWAGAAGFGLQQWQRRRQRESR